jgi:hypothetical protein
LTGQAKILSHQAVNLQFSAKAYLDLAIMRYISMGMVGL